MGTCNSADNIDRACTHNKQYVALCTGEGCSRENGDRRMCKECLEDHMCTDRVTIDDGIINFTFQKNIVLVKDKFQISEMLTNIVGTADADSSWKLLNTGIENFKKQFIDSIRSFQLLYQDQLTEQLLQSLPKEFVDQFPTAAMQIVEAKNRNDFGQIGQSGQYILIESYKDKSISQTLNQSLDESQKKLNSYLNQIELKIKQLLTGTSSIFKTVPNILRQRIYDNPDDAPVFLSDPMVYLYDLPIYVPSSKAYSSDSIHPKCDYHYESFSIICCDNCKNVDKRLCGNCLIDHKCNPSLRIKLKTFSSEQGSILDVCVRYVKKAQDVDEFKKRILQLFEEAIKQILYQIDDFKKSSSISIKSCTHKDIDGAMKALIPEYAPKLKIAFQNRSMLSLDPKAVQIIVYLIQNQNLKDKLASNSNEYQITRNYLIMVIGKLKEELEGIYDNLTQIEKSVPVKKEQGLFDTLFDRRSEETTKQQKEEVPTILKKTIQAPRIDFSQNDDFEDKIRDSNSQLIGEFGNVEDDYISSIVQCQNIIIAATKHGIVAGYNLKSNKKMFDILDEDVTCSCLAICVLNKPYLLVHQGTFEQHSINVYNLEDVNLLFTLQCHQEPIFKIKHIEGTPLIVTCSTQLIIWNLEQRKELKIVKNHTDQIRDILPLDQKRIVSCSLDRTIQVYDFQLDKIIFSVENEYQQYCLCRVNQKCFAAGQEQGLITIYSTENYGEVKKIQWKDSQINHIECVLESYLFIANKQRLNYIIRINDGKQIDYIDKDDNFEGSTEAICFADNKFIYGNTNKLYAYY